MTKQELKNKLIAIRNGEMITPLLEELWKEIENKEKIKDIIKHKINIHKQIELNHIIYPKDWHDGNIQFGEDILKIIKNL